ncbi:MAG: neutral/alkaline non-lysosomal ceramidase N-terminal domain-containing protein [Acidobacteriota bacterium]|nr:neutral/alkaline non-lysosomal ceramidase N-terminal domain-containing protein [Acidobacteriota bacterium]
MRHAARVAAVFFALVFFGCSSSGRFYQKDLRPQCASLFSSPLQISGYSFEAPACPPPCPLLAGAASEDITPPAGFPMGGAGPAGRFARGYWTRLYARAFYFRDVKGRSLALVSCDLAAVSSGLQMEVALRLHERGVNLTRENLILAATHVHHGPGDFMSFSLYNKQGSPGSGWDRDLFRWLAEKIATAVVRAKQKAESVPADVKTELVVREGAVRNLLRNRAPEPFMLNADRDEVLSEVPLPARPCPEPFVAECPRFRAVDNRLVVLEIQRTGPAGERQSAAKLVFLSVHPEAMTHDTELYQSDFTGLAMAALERREPDGYVAGFFNGADGDISVRWKRQNRAEALKFSHRLVRAVDAAAEKNRESAVQIDLGRKELVSNPYFVPNFRDSSYWPRYCVDERKGPCLAREPMFGVATVGGAEDARTPLFDLGWKPGIRGAPDSDQGVKVPAFTSPLLPWIYITRLIAASCDYPETIPLGLVALRGPGIALSFAVLPAELTRTAWRRIEKRLPSSLGRVVPVGLANEYGSYVTTREEYAFQGYEGASNTFGPFTAEVFQAELIRLAHELGPPGTRVEPAIFYPGRPLSAKESFGPESLGFLHGDPDEALEPLLADKQGIVRRHLPRFAWKERGIPDYDSAGRRVRILPVRSSDPGGDDERGPNLLTVFVNPAAEELYAYGVRRRATGSPVRRSGSKKPADRCWMAIWLPPPGVPNDQEFVFSVTLADNTKVQSVPFTVGAVSARPPATLPRSDGKAECP